MTKISHSELVIISGKSNLKYWGKIKHKNLQKKKKKLKSPAKNEKLRQSDK